MQFKIDPADYFELNRETILSDFKSVVEIESPSSDTDALRKMADFLRNLVKDRLGLITESIELESTGPALVVNRKLGGILLVCHYDTVHPHGTLKKYPFSISGNEIRGPGIYDMKGGIVMSIWSLKFLMENMSSVPDVTVLITPDEETGSLKSVGVIRDLAKSSRVSVIMEPKLSGNIKKARKGVADFTIHVDGVSAHAGVEPEKGANAIVELSRLILKAVDLADVKKGTTINVGKVVGGTATNVVPDSADAFLDIRVWTMDEFERVQKGLLKLRNVDQRTSVKVTGELNRPTMQPSAQTERIISDLLSIAVSLGLSMDAVSVGGGSDGNLIAPIGIPVIDGMGLSGGNAHTRKEFADISRLPQEFSFLCRSLVSLLISTQ